MFDFAAKNHDLLDENEKVSTLGRFHRKPESLCILPGLVPVFKRFVKAVEDLISKPSNSQVKNSLSFGKSKSDESINKDRDKDKKKLTKTDLENTIKTLESRMKKWIAEKLRKAEETRLNTEEATRKFSFSVTENNQIKFQCKHLGCSEIFLLANSPTSLYNLSNIQRHIVKSCWLGVKSKQQSSCDQEKPDRSKPTKVQTSILSYKNTSKSKVHFQLSENDGDKIKDPMEPPQSKIAKTDASTIDLTEKSDLIPKNL